MSTIMARAMKYHPPGSVLFCTVSLEEGLLLLANPLCEEYSVQGDCKKLYSSHTDASFRQDLPLYR